MIETLFLLLCCHAVADYPLQGDFLAKGKNHRFPLPGIPWAQCLLAHAMIHGGAVAIVSGSVILGFAEAVAHAVIDYGKSDGWYGFNTDQGLHIACKVAWATFAFLA